MRSKDSPCSLSMSIARLTSVERILDRSSMPHCKRLFLMSRTACLSFSTKRTLFAPRLKASIPKFPVPANRSRTTFSCISLPRMLKIDSLTRSDVGRRVLSFSVANFRPFDVPLIIRINDRPQTPSQSQSTLSKQS